MVSCCERRRKTLVRVRRLLLPRQYRRHRRSAQAAPTSIRPTTAMRRLWRRRRRRRYRYWVVLHRPTRCAPLQSMVSVPQHCLSIIMIKCCILGSPPVASTTKTKHVQKYMTLKPEMLLRTWSILSISFQKCNVSRCCLQKSAKKWLTKWYLRVLSAISFVWLWSGHSINRRQFQRPAWCRSKSWLVCVRSN